MKGNVGGKRRVTRGGSQSEKDQEDMKTKRRGVRI